MDMSLDIRETGPLFDLCRDAVIGIADGVVAFANPAAQASLSIRPGDDAAMHLPEHILNETADAFTATGSIGGQPADFSVTRAGDGRLVSIFCRTPDRGGDLPRLDRTLNELGGNLLTIRLAIDTIVRDMDVESDPRLSQYAAALYQSYYRLKRLHGHMALDQNIRRDSLPFRPVLCDLRAIFSELCGTVASMAGEMDLTLSYEAPEEPCCVMADTALVETMLLNLLANSLLHTEKGGRVSASLSRQGQRFVIAVDDRGSGIPGVRLAQLFSDAQDAELTDAAAGAGYGLFIVRGIAEKHGGTLIAESREDEGTRLRISLPAAEQQDVLELRHPAAAYRADGLNAVLTELSVVLDKKFYDQRAFD